MAHHPGPAEALPEPSPEASPETLPEPVRTAAPEELPGRPAAKQGRRGAVGTAVAAATLAAVTAFSGPGFAAPGSNPSTADRIAGVQQDLARAVALHQVSAEQAAAFERQLVRRIQADA